VGHQEAGAVEGASEEGSGADHQADSEGDQEVSEVDLTDHREASEVVAVSVPAVPPALAGETPTGDHQEVDQWDPVDPWVQVDLWDPEDLGWDLEDLGWDLEDLGWDPEVRGWVVQVDQCRPGCRDLEARECLDQMVPADRLTVRVPACWARAPETSGLTSAERSGLRLRQKMARFTTTTPRPAPPSGTDQRDLTSRF